MPALYITLRNGDSLLLGCSEAEGLAAYNAVMEDAGGFVDLNNGESHFRAGIRAADVVSVCYNPQDSETVFASSAISKIQLNNLELAQRARESAQPRQEASENRPQGNEAQ